MPSIEEFNLQDHPVAKNLSHYIKIYKLEHTCREASECPPGNFLIIRIFIELFKVMKNNDIFLGAYCMYNRCFCNSFPLRNKTSPTATTCSIDSNCMDPLQCMEGRCVCVKVSFF